MDLAMDLWHSNNIKVIVRKFLKDDCLNTELLNYVDCTSFFVLILSVWLTIKPNNLKYCSQISKKHQTFIFAKGVLQSRACSSVHLSVCLSACQFFCLSFCPSVTHFSQDLLSGYSNFLHEDILPYILKSDKARFWKIVFFV